MVEKDSMLEHIFIPFKDTKQFESAFTPKQYLLIPILELLNHGEQSDGFIEFMEKELAEHGDRLP